MGIGQLRAGSLRTRIAPAAVANFGLSGDSDLVIEGRLDSSSAADPGQHRTSLEDDAISVKHVWRRGSLQELTGVSIATECGLLLPAVRGAGGSGLGCAAIASQRWHTMEVHVNAGIARSREHDLERNLGVIVEGPQALTVKPVMELLADRGNDGTRSRSALIGAIWKYSEELAFDAGLRKARTDSQTVAEVRVGSTGSFPFHL